MEYFAAVSEEEAKIASIRNAHRERFAETERRHKEELAALEAEAADAVAAFDQIAPTQVLNEKTQELKDRKADLAALEKTARAQHRSIATLTEKRDMLLSRVRPLEQEASVLVLI